MLLSNQYYDSVYSSLQRDFPDISKIFDEINFAIHNFNKESQIKKNPVVNILISGFYNDIVVRPSQNTNSTSYGNSLNFNQIDKLNIYEYDERKIFNLDFNNKKIIGTHHFCLFKNKSILDVCFDRFFNGI